MQLPLNRFTLRQKFWTISISCRKIILAVSATMFEVISKLTQFTRGRGVERGDKFFHEGHFRYAYLITYYICWSKSSTYLHHTSQMELLHLSPIYFELKLYYMGPRDRALTFHRSFSFDEPLLHHALCLLMKNNMQWINTRTVVKI